MANKQLIIAEDFAPTGLGTITQPRSSGTITVKEPNATHLKGIASVDTMATRDLLDTSLLGGDKLILVLENSNVYSYNDGTSSWDRLAISGQFSDNGTNIGAGIQYMAKVSAVEDIVVVSGTNAFSVGDFTLAAGATLTIEADASYTIL